MSPENKNKHNLRAETEEESVEQNLFRIVRRALLVVLAVTITILAINPIHHEISKTKKELDLNKIKTEVLTITDRDQTDFLFIGEDHRQNPTEFIAKILPELKKRGFDTIFIEQNAGQIDFYQETINKYLKGEYTFEEMNEALIPNNLVLTRNNLLDNAVFGILYKHKPALEVARKLGFRVVPVDSTADPVLYKNFDRQNSSTDSIQGPFQSRDEVFMAPRIAKVLNSDSSKKFRHKYIFMAGSNHISSRNSAQDIVPRLGSTGASTADIIKKRFPDKKFTTVIFIPDGNVVNIDNKKNYAPWVNDLENNAVLSDQHTYKVPTVTDKILLYPYTKSRP